MMQFLRQIVGGEQGQALPIVLALLALGGLVIAPNLDYAATNLNSSRAIEQNIYGLYAADASVEDALWCLDNGISPSQQLPGNINQMEVTRQTVEEGAYTLYFGELVEAGIHSDYLSVDGEIVWHETAQAYRYTITVTWQSNLGAPIIHLEEVGARLPSGYSYQAGSAAGFAENLATGEPNEVLDSFGAVLLSWEFDPPYPSVSESDPVQTQVFYIAGEGSPEGDYTWAVASRGDIGLVGEITGTLYRIAAAATRPGDGETTTRVVASVMLTEETTYIVAWQVSN